MTIEIKTSVWGHKGGDTESAWKNQGVLPTGRVIWAGRDDWEFTGWMTVEQKAQQLKECIDWEEYLCRARVQSRLKQ